MFCQSFIETDLDDISYFLREFGHTRPIDILKNVFDFQVKGSVDKLNCKHADLMLMASSCWDRDHNKCPN